MKTLATIPTFTRSIEGFRTKILSTLRRKFDSIKEIGSVNNGGLYVITYDLGESSSTDQIGKHLTNSAFGNSITEYKKENDNTGVITVVSYMGAGMISYEETILVRVGISKMVISIPLSK